MFFHQSHNSIGDDIYNAFYYRDIDWQNHLHKCPEVAIVLSGRIAVTLSGREQIVEQGSSVFVMPYQLHSYKALTPSLVFVAVFSSEYTHTFSKMSAGYEFNSGVITPSLATLDYVKSGLFTVPANDENMLAVPKPQLLTLKACLYAITAEFFARDKLVECKRDDGVIYEIIRYVESNYTEDISLKTLAKNLGYDYRYLSRVFNESMGVNFKTFVNQYRCETVKSLLGSGKGTLAQIALESGFQSIRSFNRVYKEITGRSPSGMLKERRND